LNIFQRQPPPTNVYFINEHKSSESGGNNWCVFIVSALFLDKKAGDALKYFNNSGLNSND